MSEFDALSALFNNPKIIPLLLAGLAILLLQLVAKAILPKRKRRSNAKPVVAVAKTARDVEGRATQLDWISRVEFENMRLLNREEARVLPILESAVRDFGKGHRVMAQISLGEIIQPKSNSGTREENWRAFQAINSKRIDFGIFDRYGYLAAAIEYHGSGHYDNKAFMRDAVKREVFRKAGVPFFELPPDFRADDLTEQLKPLLGALARAS